MSFQDLYLALRKSIVFGALVVALIWFFNEAMTIILLVAIAAILSILLNVPVVWLERRKVSRTMATLLVLISLLVLLAMLGWLIIPRLADDIAAFSTNIPEYLSRLQSLVQEKLNDYPSLREHFSGGSPAASQIISSLPSLLGRFGTYSLSLLGTLVLLVVLLSLVTYIVIDPRPILQLYLRLFPRQRRRQAVRAFHQGSKASIAWIWSNIVVGAMEAVAVTVVLLWLDIPGALIWGTLALFAELIPRIGGYIMGVPPTLVALSVSPMTALYVAIFYIVLQIVAGEIIAPKVRSSQMKMHPALIIIMVLALGSVFGLLGALIATPLTGFLVAYVDEFTAANDPPDAQSEQDVETMLGLREGADSTSPSSA
jgi:predicted PurR-regulated permease PerM